jgi:DNA polymerase III delta prime subunit
LSTLYVKYRPQTFEDIVGNESAIASLSKAINKKNHSHAYMLTGPSGCGKCVDGNTIISTKNGLRRISEYSTNKKGFQENNISLITVDGIEKSSHFYEEDVKHTIEIHSSLGASIRGTQDHPLLTFANGSFDYKKLKDIEENDVIVGKKINSTTGNNKLNYDSSTFVKNRHDTTRVNTIFPKEINEDLAYLLGCIVGNGCMSSFYITVCSHNQNMINEMIRISNSLGFLTNYCKQKYSLDFYSRELAHFFNFLFSGEIKTARFKSIPDCIIHATKNIQVSFLKGLFDCDSYIYKDSNLLEYSTASKILKNDVLTILNNIGIIGFPRSSYNKKYEHIYWTVLLSGNDLNKWIELSGNSIKYNYDNFEYKKTNTNIKTYPGIKELVNNARNSVRKELNVNKAGRYERYGLSQVFPLLEISNGECSIETVEKYYTWLQNIWYLSKENEEVNKAIQVIDYILENNLYFSVVKKIEYIDEPSTVYDFTLPKNHNFIANGLVNHNTTVARIMAKTILKASDICINEVNASSDRGIDTAREIIQQMRYSPSDGNVSVFILDEAHMLNKTFMNAILKSIEEPPEFVYFFICTTDPGKIIATIKNRCTEIKFKSLKVEELQLVIKRVCKLESIKLSNDIIEGIAEKADGSPRKSLVILQSILGIDDEDERIKFLDNYSTTEEDPEIIELARALLNTKNQWQDIAKILKKLKEGNKLDEPETVRYIVLGYMSAVLLNGSMNKRAAIALEAFSENTFSTGKNGIILAAFNTIV